MNGRKNKLEKKPSTRKKAQGSMEYMIILAIVIIAAIVAGVLYMSAASHTKIGNSAAIVAAGYNSSTTGNTLVLAFSEPLPSGLSLTILGNSGSVSGLITSPTYVNGYPEYSFAETGTPAITTTNTVIQASYPQNGQTIVVTTSTGSPIPVQPISGTTVTP
jgi:uncharacterized protein (UPF0333 family)